MEPRDAADAAAVRLCLHGDRAAFAELVVAYQDRIYGLAWRWCRGDRTEALDIAQDVFLRAYASLGRFDPARPFAPWLLRIALNRCRDAARRRKAHPTTAEATDWAAIADPADGPEALALAAEERRAVRAAVATLPEAQRLLVLLAYDRALPLTEIAGALGLPLSLVKNRLMRARRILAARLREGEADACGDDVRGGARPVAPTPPR